MRPISVAAIVGTRPEAIKLAPVILAARSRPADFSVHVIRTGQHRELVDALLAEFGIDADVDLKLMQPRQDLAQFMAASVAGLSEVLAARRPDWVLVQGDTTSTLAGALAAFYNRIRVGHVEAGLRSGHRHSPFPEEINRSMTACLADLHFAPTESARANLLHQGIADSDIVVTGNTVVDALLRTLDRQSRTGTLCPARLAARYILVTAHRRENHGPPLHGICAGVLELLERHPDIAAWLPMHPSPDVREILLARLGAHARVHLTEPLGYVDFVRALDGAALVLTDSGGVQEECAALGRPVLVLRENTERHEALDAGVAMLVGTSPRRIVALASPLLDDPERYRSIARPTAAFGTGSASLRILDALAAARR